MTLDRSTAERLLTDLATQLDVAGIAVTIHLVGGVAVMLTARPDRAATVDVDSWINSGPDDDIRAKVMSVAAEIARRNPGVSADWLNENARMFIPDNVGGSDDEWDPYLEIGQVKIVLAPAPVLLAMKLRAGRGRRDLPDVQALIEACGLSTITEVTDLYEHYYPHDEIAPRAIAWLAANLPA